MEGNGIFAFYIVSGSVQTDEKGTPFRFGRVRPGSQSVAAPATVSGMGSCRPFSVGNGPLLH